MLSAAVSLTAIDALCRRIDGCGGFLSVYRFRQRKKRQSRTGLPLFFVSERKLTR